MKLIHHICGIVEHYTIMHMLLFFSSFFQRFSWKWTKKKDFGRTTQIKCSKLEIARRLGKKRWINMAYIRQSISFIFHIVHLPYVYEWVYTFVAGPAFSKYLLLLEKHLDFEKPLNVGINIKN